MSECYRVVFTGKIEPGRDQQQVIDQLSEKFRLDRGIAEKVIRSGRSVSLKKDLTLEMAERYLAVLLPIGILVEIDPKPPEPEPAVASTDFELEFLDNGSGDTTEMLEYVPGIGRCPKCDSTNMEAGICQDCGIVAAKYLAAQAAVAENEPSAGEKPSEQANPYSAPEADLEEPMEGEMTGPTGVPAGNGLAWIGKGWWHFKSSPLAWIGALVVFVIISLVLSIIPVMGSIVSFLIGPVITAGFMYGCQEQDAGGDFSVSHLFVGFSNNVGQLMLVAVFYFVMMLLIGLVMMGVMFLFAGEVPELQSLEAFSMFMLMTLMTLVENGGIYILILLFFLLMMPLVMAYLFAPALVMLDNLSALQAMKYSFVGCLKNMLSLTIFGLVAFILLIIGSLPFGLGLLVVFPMLTAGIYASYRDIYFS